MHVNKLYSMHACRYAGAKSIYLIIWDGGADWQSTIPMIQSKFPWVQDQYCCGHGTSKIVQEIFKIPVVSDLHFFLHAYAH